MLSGADFKAIVSGRRTDLLARALRAAFAVIEGPYAAIAARRLRRFNRPGAATHCGVPVVCVGNLTLGGVGKTPMVEYLARHCQHSGRRVAIVSRGYGAKPGKPNDEALELAQKLPDVPHLQDRDRVAAALRAVGEQHAEIIVLDDGFQHRRLARDLDIVLVDALEPFGYEHVFPRGTLREPLSGFARAHVIALTRADAVPEPERESIRKRIAGYNPRAIWVETAHAPRALITCAGDELPLDTFAGSPVLAFCGIGNPAGFRHVLAQQGYNVGRLIEFPDHHAYTAADCERLAQLAGDPKFSATVCTRKDLVKVSRTTLGGKPLVALAIELQVLCGREALHGLLAPLLQTKN